MPITPSLLPPTQDSIASPVDQLSGQIGAINFDDSCHSTEAIAQRLAGLKLIDAANGLSAVPISPFLVSQPRTDKSRRPPITTDIQWQSVPTPCKAAMREVPFTTILANDWHLSHGNSTLSLPEHVRYARLQRIDLPCKPPCRPARQLPSQPVPTRLPSKGSADDLFVTTSFTSSDHGDWVRARLRASKGNKRNRGNVWVLSPSQIVEEIIIWFESVAEDIRNAKLWHQRGANGKFRPRTKLWVIPVSAHPAWAQGVVWDTAAFFAASKQDRRQIQIRPQNWAKVGHNPWNTEQLKQWAEESGMQDEACMQDLHEAGVHLTFKGSWASVLAPPSLGFYEKIQVAQEVTHKEIADGWLSTPVMGPHLIPLKCSSRNVATIFKDTALKHRPTANLGCPDKKSLHLHAANEGFDMENDIVEFPKMVYTCPNLIAHHVATIIPACSGNFILCKNDWKS